MNYRTVLLLFIELVIQTLGWTQPTMVFYKGPFIHDLPDKVKQRLIGLHLKTEPNDC